MADLKAFFADRSSVKPVLMDHNDCRKWSSVCPCSVCKQRKRGSQKQVIPLFDNYNNITLAHY